MLRTWLKPPSSTHCWAPAVIHSESMPSASWARTVPAMVSARLETTVVSSIVNEICGGPAAPARRGRPRRTTGRGGLSPLEFCGALFEKCGRPLFHVLCGGEQAEVIRLEQQALVERHLQALIDGFHGQPYSQRPHREDTPHHLLGFSEEIRGRHDLVDQPNPVGLLRVDHLTGQNQLQGDAF